LPNSTCGIRILFGFGCPRRYWHLHFSWWGWISALFSYRNLYAAAGGSSLVDERYSAHFWSLAVEEHFYLFLPVLMVITRRRLVPVLLFVTALSLIWPPIVHRLKVLQTPEMGWRTDINVQSMLVAGIGLPGVLCQ
jgi:peptidoglycan/LPS O-acetylase OafA/YrhL